MANTRLRSIRRRGGLRERGRRYGPAIPEEQVIALWLQHALPGRALPLRDGGSALIVTAGRRSSRDGPDFTGAVVRIDGEERRGAVEVHVREADWLRHRHDRDPRYAAVILHVVLYEDEGCGPALPTIALTRVLTRSLRTSWTRALAAAAHETVPACRDAAFLAPPAQRDAMLRLAAEERFEEKTNRVMRRWEELLPLEQERAAHERIATSRAGASRAGASRAATAARRQLLYEMLLRALGYGGNEEAFQDLARRLPFATLMACSGGDALGRYALLARAAGVDDELAATLPPQVAERFERLFERAAAHAAATRIPGAGTGELRMPDCRATEHFTSRRCRPRNSPLVRLRWMACFMPRLTSRRWWGRLLRAGEEAARRGGGDMEALRVLLAVDAPSQPAPARSMPMLGRQRSDEIIVNIFAPFLSACARRSGRSGLRAASYAVSMQLQPAPENAVSRRLATVFGLTLPLVSWQQQGLMQLHARYCSRFQCAGCLIGRSVFQ